MKLKTTIFAGMLAIAASASAQFANTGGSQVASVDTEDYDRITISYNPQTISFDYDGADDITATGFSLGYTHGFSVSKQYPLFVEVGARLNYAFHSDDYDELVAGNDYYDDYEVVGTIKQKTNYMNLVVPVNIAYKFAVGKVYITPYTGITLKANILAKSSFSADDVESGYEDAADDYVDENYEDIDHFDKKDVGKDGQWKRFQFGWQIGAGVDFNNYYVGLHYGLDFSELAKKTNSSNWAITLGYNF